MGPAPGDELLHYSIERKLGEGGMGEVWLARDTRLDRSVALKFLSRSAALDPQARERLAREARAASSLNHPNILTIYAVENFEGRDFIAMEFAEGQSLEEWLTGRTPDFEELVDLALQIGEGLSAAHAKGIVHRDVKPSNVMVSSAGRAQVMDFGLAKVSSEPQLTQTGSTLGTLAYMSPEQVRGAEIDPRSDVFSFGAMLYELLTGRAPFAREAGVAAVLNAILNDAPPPPSSLREDLPRGTDAVLARALEKDRERRYESLHPLLADLRALRGDSGSEMVPAAPARTSPWLYAIPVLGVALGLWLAFGRGRSESGPTPAAPPGLTPRLLSHLGGSPHAATFSPDGAQLAFLDEVDGTDQLFVTGIDEGEPRQLTSVARSVQRPRWAPTGHTILYHHAEVDDWQRGGQVFSISSLGGEPRRLLDGARSASWSADGRQIVFERAARIWIADADGGGARVLEHIQGLFNPLVGKTPALSPDGRHVVYFGPELGPMGRLWIADVAGGQPRVLSEGLEMARDPVFTPDGRWILYSSDWSGPRTLWRMPVEPGGSPQAVTSGAGEDSEPCPSPDGGRVVFTNERNEFVLQVWDLLGESEPEILRSSRSTVLAPTWSPDGTRIALFGEARQPGSHLLLLDRDGKGLVQVTRGGSEINLFPIWSPDGEFLYYYKESGEGRGYYRAPLDGGPSVEVAAGWAIQTHPFPTVRPDGRALLTPEFLSDADPRVIEFEFETGREREFPFPVFRACYSRDGQRLVGEWPPGVMQHIDLATGETRSLGEGQHARFGPGGWTILFLVPEDERWILWSHELETGERRRLLDLGRMFEQAPAYDVSEAGEVVWSEFRGGRSELWLLE